MKTYRHGSTGRALVPLAVACAALVLLGGCRRLEMDVNVARDGGGERRLVMTVEPGDVGRDTLSEGQVRELLGVTAGRGWRDGTSERTGDDGKPQVVTTYTRASRVAALGDWPRAGSDIRMRAAADGAPHADVQLGSRVAVETGRGAGVTTWTYRETFAWDGLQELFAGVAADRYRDAMAAAFPALGATELAELRGLARGAFTVGVRAGGAGEREADLDEELVIGALADAAAGVVGRARGGSAERLREVAAAVVKDQDNVIGDYLDRELPGVAIAAETTFALTLRLPGRVVETNGEVAADGSVRWEFGGADPAGRPLECWARSESAP